MDLKKIQDFLSLKNFVRSCPDFLSHALIWLKNLIYNFRNFDPLQIDPPLTLKINL